MPNQVITVAALLQFAPVAKIRSIHLLLAIAAILDWEVHIIDVDSAFLNSDLPPDQAVYLAQPPGHVAKGKEDYVWLLLKGLYGLKQSGHLWYQKLKGILLEIGFSACKSDPCIHHPKQSPLSHHMLTTLGFIPIPSLKSNVSNPRLQSMSQSKI